MSFSSDTSSEGFEDFEVIFAESLGVSLNEEFSLELLEVATRALYILPDGWEVDFMESELGTIPFFFDTNNDQSHWEHPYAEDLKLLIEEKRQELMRGDDSLEDLDLPYDDFVDDVATATFAEPEAELEALPIPAKSASFIGAPEVKEVTPETSGKSENKQLVTEEVVEPIVASDLVRVPDVVVSSSKEPATKEIVEPEPVEEQKTVELQPEQEVAQQTAQEAPAPVETQVAEPVSTTEEPAAGSIKVENQPVESGVAESAEPQRLETATQPLQESTKETAGSLPITEPEPEPVVASVKAEPTLPEPEPEEKPPTVEETAAVPAAVEEVAQLPPAEPEVVAEAAKAAEPEVAVQPEVTTEPAVVAEPEVLIEPEAAAEPEVVAAPAVVAEPEIAVVPSAMAEPEPVAEPEQVAEPEVAPQLEVPTEPEVAAELETSNLSVDLSVVEEVTAAAGEAVPEPEPEEESQEITDFTSTLAPQSSAPPVSIPDLFGDFFAVDSCTSLLLRDEGMDGELMLETWKESDLLSAAVSAPPQEELPPPTVSVFLPEPAVPSTVESPPLAVEVDFTPSTQQQDSAEEDSAPQTEDFASKPSTAAWASSPYPATPLDKSIDITDHFRSLYATHLMDSRGQLTSAGPSAFSAPQTAQGSKPQQSTAAAAPAHHGGKLSLTWVDHKELKERERALKAAHHHHSGTLRGAQTAKASAVTTTPGKHKSPQKTSNSNAAAGQSPNKWVVLAAYGNYREAERAVALFESLAPTKSLARQAFPVHSKLLHKPSDEDFAAGSDSEEADEEGSPAPKKSMLLSQAVITKESILLSTQQDLPKVRIARDLGRMQWLVECNDPAMKKVFQRRVAHRVKKQQQQAKRGLQSVLLDPLQHHSAGDSGEAPSSSAARSVPHSGAASAAMFTATFSPQSLISNNNTKHVSGRMHVHYPLPRTVSPTRSSPVLSISGNPNGSPSVAWGDPSETPHSASNGHGKRNETKRRGPLTFRNVLANLKASP